MKSFSSLANYILHNQAIIGPYARIRPELKVREAVIMLAMAYVVASSGWRRGAL
ncbi:hypothetical protein [Entomobacter blattae]|uniref:Uncharacterized protein n=1 Tax=Entomobacter blattae TaxID=2762277 RepID=A0A7H1NR37_9PROT|nr:hypothetical protein [Entomobacter blattae]QNT78247.1 hypothetical protein JGUZn3_10190 [Entomobacter blattae]